MGAENSFRTVRRLRKTRFAGRDELVKPLPGEENRRKSPRLAINMNPNEISRFNPFITEIPAFD